MRPIQNNVLYLNLTEILEAGMIRKDYKQRYCSWWLSNKESTCTKKRSWSVFGGLLPVWSTTAFWILGKPLHLRSMLSKLRYTKNCSAYSWHWSTGRVQFFSTMPVHTLHNQCFKSWTNWAVKLCFIYHMHLTSWQPTTTSSISTTFCRENISTISRRQKRLSKGLSNPEAWLFMLQE